jgi:succinyl-diaminopimelate desuccinylase
MKTLLQELIRAESTAEKGELTAAEVLCTEFRRSGIDCTIDRWDLNRANMTARVKSAGRRPGLLFACHLDVVGPGEAAWTHPAFGAIEADGKIYGRGAVDMKGGMAAAATAIGRVIEAGTRLQGDIILAAVAGEETDSSGAERFVAERDRLPKLAGVIIPEPTDFAVVTAHRGMLWLQVTTTGKAAHSSTPYLGVNAIASMRLILNELENYDVSPQTHELLGKCTMSVNTIAGGKAMNVVPDKCTLGIDIRTLPGQDHRQILADLEAILTRLKSKNSDFDAEVSVLRRLKPLETDSRCDFVRDFCSGVGADRITPVGYTTDGPHFASLGAPVVIFGPGKPGLCHKPDEHIEISDLEKAAEHYKNVILEFLT